MNMIKLLLMSIALFATSSVQSQQIAATKTHNAASTEQSASVERPEVKVGESWKYRTIDIWTGKVQTRFSVSAASVSEKEIEFTYERPRGVASLIETSSLNTIRSVSSDGTIIVEYSPDSGNFSFPLTVGKTWPIKTDYKISDRVVVLKLDAEVVEWEKVVVPAGEFLALKIVRKGSYQTVSGITDSWSGRVLLISWYVPSVKRNVKQEYEDTHGDGHIYNRTRTELESYMVAR